MEDDWIIGICCTSTDGVRIFKFHGTQREVKAKLLSMVKEDRENDTGNWNFGCTSIDDVRSEYNGIGYELYAYGCYHDYHIDYTAKKFSHIENA